MGTIDLDGTVPQDAGLLTAVEWIAGG